MAQYLVTGANGYIGSHLVQYLLDKEDDSYVVCVDKEDYQWHYDCNRQVNYKIDLSSEDECQVMYNYFPSRYKFDGIFHLAALSEVGGGIEKPFSYFDNNVNSTINLLKFLYTGYMLDSSWNPAPVVFASSGSVYNPRSHNTFYQDRTGYYNEDDPVGRDYEREISAYPLSKITCERLMQSFSREFDIPTTSLRFSNVAGRVSPLYENHDPETHLIPKFMYNKGDTFQIFGDGTQIRDYIHVEDVCSAMYHASVYMDQRGGYDVFNISNHYGFTTLQIVNKCKEILSKANRNSPKVKFVPPRTGDVNKMILNNGKAIKILWWRPEKNIDDIITSMLM